MKNKLVFICPYFGKIGMDQFELWLKSCATNSSVDFMLFINDEDIFAMNIPDNVKLIRMSWDECRQLIQSHFDFEVTLVYPYKLCDFKPAFGYIFADYIRGYDFWGHLDLSDTILGNLREFITDPILDLYDKIHIYGHLTLYRNETENNLRFTAPQRNGVSIKDIFKRAEVTCFDDMYHTASVNSIYKEHNYPMIEEIDGLVADVLPHDWYFRLYQDGSVKIPRAFEWDNGKLFELCVINGSVAKREIGYVHFQKRKTVNYTAADTDHFYFVPNMFIDADKPLSAEDIVAYSKDRLYLDPVKGQIKRLAWYMKHPSVFMRKLHEKLSDG